MAKQTTDDSHWQMNKRPHTIGKTNDGRRTIANVIPYLSIRVKGVGRVARTKYLLPKVNYPYTLLYSLLTYWKGP
ncbi:MAG: hypothetical protein AB2705_12230, partial [Candidatus Thiodiazotropha sp.]